MKNYILLVCLVCIGSFIAKGQSNISFRTINKDNGLVDNYVEQVFEDSRGFMWFATHEGLCRFDGYRFEYYDMPQIYNLNISIISRNYINSINEDDKHNLWIGTLAGVYIFNQEKCSFTFLSKLFTNKTMVEHNFVEQIVFDKAFNAWIGTRGGLTFYNQRSGRFEHFFHDTRKGSISNNFIYAICVDSKGNTWIGTRDGGLDKVAKDRKTFIHYFNQLQTGIPDLHIRSIFEDSKRNLWVLTAQAGLFCKQNKSNVFAKVPLIDNRTHKAFVSLFQNLNEDIYGNIWISTASDGVVIYNPKSKSSEFYNEGSLSSHRICGNSVESISRDRHGNMWLATHGGGVSMYSPMTSWFSYFPKSEMPNGLSGNLVSSFFEDHNGIVWLGTDGNGFAKYNKSNGTFDTFTKANGLSSNAVLDIYEIKKDILAIATYSGGLNLFNTKTKVFSHYLYPSTRSDANLQNIYGLHFDAKNNVLWCNTFGDGIQVFDCNTMKFYSQKQRENLGKQFGVSVFSIKTVIDRFHNIWVADGLQFFRIHNNNSINYSKEDRQKNIHSVNFVTDMLSDSKGKLWVTTYRGVMNYDSQKDGFLFFKKSGYDLTEARSLLEDSVGNVWISTNSALFRYNRKTNAIQNISLKWGVPQMQYFRKSALRSRDGQLFFGGLKGFVVLNEKKQQQQQIVQPKLYITRLFINNVEQKRTDSNAIVKKDISFLSKLELTYDRNYLTLEFASLNYIDNEKSRFKYILKGFNNTWIETDKDRKAQFTNLPPGEYLFLLKTTDSNGDWIEKPLLLQIIVLPPWWKTVWFRFLLIVVLLLAVWKLIKVRELAIKKKNEQLEKLVEVRTLELKATNENLKQQKSTIQHQYEDIKENHFVIELKNNQLQDTLELKDKLLTVIAHDLKNPLTALQGSLKIIQKKVYEKGLDDMKKNVDSVVSTSIKLMEQMVNILDWSLGNDKTIVHIPIDTNLENGIADILSLLSELAQRKSISIIVKNECKHAAYVDPRMISAVIRNIVINSIKYTDENGTIWITLSENEQTIICEIKDTGRGMDQTFVDKIMSSNELHVDEYHNGFGLMICKTFIKRNKGSFQIKSEIDKGTSFQILLPKGSELKTTRTSIPVAILDQKDDTLSDSEMSMLIIDDSKDIIGYLSEEFSDSFMVYGAYDGKKGLQIAHNIVPDIILCDVNMPVFDGLTFCKMIKSDSLTSHVPVILLSARSLQTDQIEGLQSGADDYVTKPFDIRLLKQKVYAIIKNRKLLNHSFKTSNVIVEKYELPESYSDKITSEATTIIMANLNNPDFSVDTLAVQLCMSRSQLYRKFLAVLGQTPKEYILTIKFEKAIEMLKTKKYRIADIAYELGFTDSHYFSLCFSQRFGVSPTNYFPKEN